MTEATGKDGGQGFLTAESVAETCKNAAEQWQGSGDDYIEIVLLDHSVKDEIIRTMEADYPDVPFTVRLATVVAPPDQPPFEKMEISAAVQYLVKDKSNGS